MNKVDVVIPNYNGANLLKKLLPMTIAMENIGNIIVVDDAGTDNSADVAKSFPEIQLIKRTQNGGFSVAVNQGIAETSSDFIAVFNTDIVVPKDLFSKMLPVFDDDSVFSVSPKVILTTRNNLDEGCKTGFWHHGMFYTDQDQNINKITPVLYTSACSAIYRKSMLNALNCFDEIYAPFYWEDTDLCYRAWKRGWQSLYFSDATVFHLHSASISRLRKNYTDTIKARNSFFFVWRNIEDKKLLKSHFRWLPLVLLKKIITGNISFIKGYFEAAKRKNECIEFRNIDTSNRIFSDEEIFDRVKIN